MLHTVNKPAAPQGAPLSITKTVRPSWKTIEIDIGVTDQKQVAVEADSYCATPVTEAAVKASDAVKPPRKRNKKTRIEAQAIPLENLKWLTIATKHGGLPHPCLFTKEMLAEMVLEQLEKFACIGHVMCNLDPHELLTIALPYAPRTSR